MSELDALLKAMPPGQIDMEHIAAVEQRRGSRFFDDPRDIVHRWLLERQRRLLGIDR
jgi:hypothetical protein